MEDSQIIELYFQREETAIEETAAKYGGYCFDIANRILEDQADSEECVNDTWLKAWNAIPPARPTYLRLFLGKITRNLSFNRYREMHREKRGGGGEAALVLEEMDEFLADTADVESEVEQAEFVRVLNRFLYSLPERECNIFIRRYFYTDRTEAIAKHYGLKESHVLVILSRTRKKLSKVLEKEGYMI